jgi:hypothetical protein
MLSRRNNRKNSRRYRPLRTAATADCLEDELEAAKKAARRMSDPVECYRPTQQLGWFLVPFPMPYQYYQEMEFDLDDLEARALFCVEATIPGPELRELIRLAKIGAAIEGEGPPLYSVKEHPTTH